MMTLSQIWIYPVKSCYGIPLTDSEVLFRGLAFDRRWMFVSPTGAFLTQREYPELVLIGTKLSSHSLTLFDRRNPSSSIDLPLIPSEASTIKVAVWSDTVKAMRYGKDVSKWIEETIGLEAFLVKMEESTKRQVDTRYGQTGQYVSFADGYPLLVSTESAIELLNQKLADPIDMRRFRPNIVIAGALPHDEDDWTEFSIGSVRFSGVKKCARCPVTTINPDSAEKGKEPLKMLGTYRRSHGKVYFGQNTIPLTEGRIKLGDTVGVMSRKSGET